jgi:uncharacterized membrane protein (UPF0127 family)
MWLTLHTANRDDITVLSEVMRTPEDHARGMMYRHHFPDDRLMLFMYSKDGAHRIWMKNCRFPLDVAWLDSAGRVVDSILNAPPCKAEPCPIYGTKAPTRYFIEGTAGWLARYGVEKGTVIGLGPLLPTVPLNRP